MPSLSNPAALLLFGTVVYTLMALVLLRYRHSPGAPVTAFAMASCLTWVAGSLATAVVPGISAKMVAMSFLYVGVCLAPTAILAFVTFYARPEPLGARAIRRLLVIPIITILVIWTNPWHEWMWAHPSVDDSGVFTVASDWGPWFLWVHLPYNWGLVLVAAFHLARATVVRRGTGTGAQFGRRHAFLLFVALVGTFGVNVVTVSNVGSSYPVSPTAVAMALSSVGFLFIFLRMEIVPLRHVAHRRILATIPDAVFVVNEQDRIVEVNPRAVALSSLGESSVGRTLRDVFRLEGDLRAFLEDEGERNAVVTLSDGRSYDARVSPVLDGRGSRRGRTLLMRDVTENRLQEERLRSIVDVSPNGIVRLCPVFDEAGTLRDLECTFANAAAAEYLGFAAHSMEGVRMLQEMPAVGPQLLGMFQDCLVSHESRRVDVPVAGEEADPRWFRVIAAPVESELTVTFVEVTEEKRREAEMQEVAFTDPLTRVLNRRGLEQAFDAMGTVGRRESDAHTLLYMDLDRFKPVNDTYGHPVGDRLLKEFAARLRSVTRDGDLIARIGGDEFVVVLLETDSRAALDTVDRLIRATEAPYWISGGVIACRPSVGVAHVGGRTSLSQGLIDADRAMYLAKASGGGSKRALPKELSASV